MDKSADLFEKAKAVLEMNNHGDYTMPAHGLYPHQWLWDSCFVSIGLRHYDIPRAKQEILSLFRGQWTNGMLPNMIIDEAPHHIRIGKIWNSSINPFSPDKIPTSGITQPPMVAEAVVRIGEKLSKAERRSWYKTVYIPLLNYHRWLYTERNPHEEGLAVLIHPWETGLDNTPPWMAEMHDHTMPTWVRIFEKLHLDTIVTQFRRDTRYVPADERMTTIEALALYSTQRRIRRKAYEFNRILPHSLFAVEDLTFNAILIRASQHLETIAKTINEELPEELTAQTAKAAAALESLWDPYSSQYFSRNFVTHILLKESSIATLMPLYAGCITKERAKQLVKLLHDEHWFGTSFPVPTVPANSPWFNPIRYWQGPTWINTNWLLIDGLKRYGFDDEAAALTEATIELVQNGGFHEYFSPLDGSPAGADNFSWTAALAIDLLKRKP